MGTWASYTGRFQLGIVYSGDRKDVMEGGSKEMMPRHLDVVTKRYTTLSGCQYPSTSDWQHTEQLLAPGSFM